MRGYEFVEHTADIGLRIYGRDLRALFTHAGMGFLDLVTDPARVRSEEEERVTLQAADAGELLLKWLRELLFLFSAKGMAFSEFTIQKIDETRLQATLGGEKFSTGRHDQRHEVKAVTYHGFKLEKGKGGWTAEVIFDI